MSCLHTRKTENIATLMRNKKTFVGKFAQNFGQKVEQGLVANNNPS